MGCCSDVTIMAGAVAYEMLKKAWEADGIIPVLDKKVEKEVRVVKFKQLHEFGIKHEIFYVLKGLEYMESKKEAYAFKAIAIHKDNTFDVYANKAGNVLFEDFGVKIKVMIPSQFLHETDETDEKSKDDKKENDGNEHLLNVRGILEQTVALLDGNLKTDLEHAILTDTVSALNTFYEPGVIPYVIDDLFKSIYRWAEPFVEEEAMNDYEILRSDILGIWN